MHLAGCYLDAGCPNAEAPCRMLSRCRMPHADAPCRCSLQDAPYSLPMENQFGVPISRAVQVSKRTTVVVGRALHRNHSLRKSTANRALSPKDRPFFLLLQPLPRPHLSVNPSREHQEDFVTRYPCQKQNKSKQTNNNNNKNPL